MGRLSKLGLKKRESIKELGIFKRNALFYTNFESESLNVKPYQSSYAFCGACRIRSLGNDRAQKLTNLETKNIVDSLMEYASGNQKQVLDKLKEIDEQIYCRSLHNLMGSNGSYAWNQTMDYSACNLVDYNELRNIIGGELVDEFYDPYFDPHMETTFACISQRNSHHLTKKEKMLIATSNLQPITIIKRHSIYPVIEEYVDKHRITYVELDFTKPLAELIDFVTKIKNDFDNDRSSIKTLDDLCEPKGTYGEIFTCDLEKDDIFKLNYKKPIGGRLADILYIYDCRKAGLNNEYILEEINKYWTEIKNLYKERIQVKTLRLYHSVGIDYIDNKKYECYLSGYDKVKENI